MEQVVGVEALGADLLLALQTEQNEVLGVQRTLLGVASDDPFGRRGVFQEAALRTFSFGHRSVELELYLAKVQQVLWSLRRGRLRLDLGSSLNRLLDRLHLLWEHLLRQRGRK